MYVEIKNLLVNDSLSCKFCRKTGLVPPRIRDGGKARPPQRCWDDRPLFDYLARFGSASALQIMFQGIDCRYYYCMYYVSC